jgi:hypothetical protein
MQLNNTNLLSKVNTVSFRFKTELTAAEWCRIVCHTSSFSFAFVGRATKIHLIND